MLTIINFVTMHSSEFFVIVKCIDGEFLVTNTEERSVKGHICLCPEGMYVCLLHRNGEQNLNLLAKVMHRNKYYYIFP
jgi:hypothetical protein